MRAIHRLARLSESQYGAFSRRQALQAGFTPDMIDGRLANRYWIRMYRGVYRLAGVPISNETLVMAAVLAAGRTACASHLTAGALLWKLDGLSAPGIELSVGDRRDLAIDGVVVHRPRTLFTTDRTKIGPIPVTTPSRTIIDVASLVDERTLEVALDDALRRRLIRRRSLANRIGATPPHGRKGIGSLRRLLSERSGPVTESALETKFIQLVRDAGLPRPQLQYEVRGRDGSFVARVDFAYPEAKLAVEIDGYAFHEGRKQWDNDRARQNALVDLGWTVLRFTKTDLMDRKLQVAVSIEKALTGPGRPSTSRAERPRTFTAIGLS